VAEGVGGVEAVDGVGVGWGEVTTARASPAAVMVASPAAARPMKARRRRGWGWVVWTQRVMSSRRWRLRRLRSSETWYLAPSREMPRCWPISLLVSPSATRRATSSCRSVSEGAPLGSRGSRVGLPRLCVVRGECGAGGVRLSLPDGGVRWGDGAESGSDRSAEGGVVWRESDEGRGGGLLTGLLGTIGDGGVRCFYHAGIGGLPPAPPSRGPSWPPTTPNRSGHGARGERIVGN
jgi:hypothetical protein